MQSPKPRVAVINDEATQRAALAGLLLRAGCSVLEFSSAEASLGSLTEAPPHLIITDLHMPGLDGWRFCRLLRSPEYAMCNQIPILVVSATFSGDEPRQLTAGMGANAFLPSPVDAAQFTALVHQLLTNQPPSSAPQVLIVEDDLLLAGALSKAFEQHGYQVALAHSGLEARRWLQTGRPDSAVLDYHLPDLTGDLLLQELQARPEAPAVVMMTGDVDPELALRFVKLGARAYVHKPFELEYLLALCESARRERSLLRVEHLLEQRTLQLRESDERLRVMADNAPSMMLLLDSQCFVHQLNRAALDFSSQPGAELLGIGPGHLLGCLNCSTTALGCGGAPACRHCALRGLVSQALKTGQSRPREELRLQVPSSGSPQELLLRASAARVEVGGQPMALVCLEDITGLRHLEEQLRQAQKMEAVGQLAGGIAHDFNNILAVMLMQLSLLQQDPSLPPSLGLALQELQQGSERVATLTRQLLTFSRRHIMQMGPLELNGLLAELRPALTELLGPRIQLLLQGHAEPLWVEADTAMLQQLLTNLCLNAREAMPQGGRLSLQLDWLQLGAPASPANPQGRPGAFVRLRLADTGCGMSPEVQGRIFEPFFTTKAVGKGPGLGLAAAYGIVRQHSGWIEVQSQVGLGSLFRVFLPLVPAPPLAMPPPAQPKASVPQQSRKTLLVLEEDELLRVLNAQRLRQLGYRVFEASSGTEALQLWNDCNGQIDLLLSDTVLPEGINGLELAQRLIGLKARLQVIICSAFPPASHDAALWAKPQISFLAKPYEFDSLLTLVAQRLSQPGKNPSEGI